MVVDPIHIRYAPRDGVGNLDVHAATEQHGEPVLGDRNTVGAQAGALSADQEMCEWVYLTLSERNHRTARVAVDVSVYAVDRSVGAAEVPRYANILAEVASYGRIPAISILATYAITAANV